MGNHTQTQRDDDDDLIGRYDVRQACTSKAMKGIDR